MFVLGQAPGGFAQVEKPRLKCTAVSGLTAGSSFVNIADVGGVYNDQWVQAISRWVTTVYGKTETLPLSLIHISCSPFFVGVGNSFHNAFWVYLRYHQGRRPVQNGRDEKPMHPDRPGPPYEGM